MASILWLSMALKVETFCETCYRIIQEKIIWSTAWNRRRRVSVVDCSDWFRYLENIFPSVVLTNFSPREERLRLCHRSFEWIILCIRCFPTGKGSVDAFIILLSAIVHRKREQKSVLVILSRYWPYRFALSKIPFKIANNSPFLLNLDLAHM
jgi:hypothetical protein